MNIPESKQEEKKELEKEEREEKTEENKKHEKDEKGPSGAAKKEPEEDGMKIHQDELRAKMASEFIEDTRNLEKFANLQYSVMVSLSRHKRVWRKSIKTIFSSLCRGQAISESEAQSFKLLSDKKDILKEQLNVYKKEVEDLHVKLEQKCALYNS